MKILLINAVCGTGSTGRICTDLARQFEKEGHEVKIAYGRTEAPERFQKYGVRIGSSLDVKIHGIRTRVLDEHGFGSVRATKSFLKWAEDYNPDLLWLHNIHGYYINVELLFAWIKSRPQMQVKWTLHDCWSFTGHCAYFSVAQCDQWKTHCYQCVQKDTYPISKYKDNCKANFERKKRAFTGVKKMQLITPSQWLADLVKESFLKEYPVEVCYNTIDTDVFRLTPGNFRQQQGLEDKKIVLGVASTWTEKKGLGDFVKLEQMLDDHYGIVLVGIDENHWKRFKEDYLTKKNHITDRITGINGEKLEFSGGIVIPPNVERLYREITGEEWTEKKAGHCRVLCIPRTNDVRSLAEIYTAADLFVNPTYEDNYPTVNLEARACGTKVITYDSGGCRETLM